MIDTRILVVDPESPDPAALAEAGDMLRRGGLVVFPTETVYGLGANALDAAAVQRIYEAKDRPRGNPVIVHVADIAFARALTAHWPREAQALAERFWPGPLTLVLPRSPLVPEIVTGGGDTVGIRVPAHPVALALLRHAGVPVAAPSANRAMGLSPTRPEHVVRDLNGRVELLLAAGPTTGGIESSVIDLTCSPPRLLRPGLATPSQIEAIIGRIERHDLAPRAGGPLRSPGMLARHYAPRAALQLVGADVAEYVQDLVDRGLRVGLLGLRPQAQPPGVIMEVMPTNAAAYAARLYDALHRLDASGVDRIIVELPPDGEEWLAVRDRLRRAATPGAPAPPGDAAT